MTTVGSLGHTNLPKYVLYVNDATANVEAMVQSCNVSIHIQHLRDLEAAHVTLPTWLRPSDPESWPVLVDSQELWGRRGDAALQFIFERTQRPPS